MEARHIDRVTIVRTAAALLEPPEVEVVIEVLRGNALKHGFANRRAWVP